MSELPWNLFSSYAGLLTLAATSIYSGSRSSLRAPPKPKTAKGSTSSVNSDDESSDEEDAVDNLSASDAYWFPVLGSCVLVTMYAVVKYLGTEWINRLLGWYFAFAGAGAVWQTLVDVSRAIAGPARWRALPRYTLSLTRARHAVFSLPLPLMSVIMAIPAMIPSVLYTISPAPKSAILTNVLALSLAHTALGLLRLDSFKTGVILLSGLFLYDIWWVFGTDVMVSVATSLDVPIKILWPKSLTFASGAGFTMLGLGDIVIPGVFVALALRFDQRRALDMLNIAPSTPVPLGALASFSTPYFTAALIAYVLGLTTTMVVMHTFGAAQPALLYLSPACILSFFITATARGELSTAWAWDGELVSKTDSVDPPSKRSAVSSDDDEVDVDSEDDTEVSVDGKPRRRRGNVRT